MTVRRLKALASGQVTRLSNVVVCHLKALASGPMTRFPIIVVCCLKALDELRALGRVTMPSVLSPGLVSRPRQD